MGSELRRTVQLRALSKPTPRRIWGLLKGKDLSPCVSSQLSETELCVCDLANEIGCNPSTITRHLRVLREAGLVHASRRGPFVNSRRDQGAFEDLLKYLNTLR